MKAHAHRRRRSYSERLLSAIADELAYLAGGDVPKARDIVVFLCQGITVAFGLILAMRLVIAVLNVVYPVLVPEAWQ